MSNSDRSKLILEELISNPRITSMALEKKYNLTRRQLGYSVNKVNEWLLTKNLPVIERTRQGHFIIDQEVFTTLTGDEKEPSITTAVLPEKQRVYLIILMLLSYEEELSLNHFTSELAVSKNTVLSDMKQVQSFLDDYHLIIRYSRKSGYVLEGKEFQIRKLLINVTYMLLQYHGGRVILKNLAKIEESEVDEFMKRIEKIETTLNLKFTDEKIGTMPYVFILILKRIQHGRILQSFSIKYENLSNTKEYQATEEIFRHSNVEIPVEERLFCTLHLLTSNVYWSEYLTEADTIPDLVPAIDTMLELFEKSTCIYFQNKEQLLNNLLQHIKPAYYRIKYHLTDTIEIHNSLSKEFKELHHLIKRCIGPLEKLIGSKAPENETAYITMLIGGWMRRQGDSIEKKIKAIVVCPQGVSVSGLMFNELRELFPEFVFLDSLSVRGFQEYDLEYDIVFSPTFLETEKKLFVSKAFLGRDEKYRLRKQVMLELYGYIPNDINVNHLIDIIRNHTVIKNEEELTRDLQSYINREEESSVKHTVKKLDSHLHELILPEYITKRKSVGSWEEAIRISSEPLIRKGHIEPKYVEAMLHRTSEDPYIVIGSNVAIPHAAPDEGVNEVGMSLLKLENGVAFTSEYKINLIIVIAAVDKQKHIHALMQLMKLAGSEVDRNRVIHSDSVEEIHEIIKSYSKEQNVVTEKVNEVKR
ncbi:BglG family transcription antiterminator [Guptibacillus hwajinpoensis]|uniref:BglG family transcription antiterminator n=1 Tax=Guptibacillus hwajinpoensis TaxID=208199 RepID=UPI0024B3974C|nr:BglG family transcription antiterminator [Pseudalkalibacillus hwajinpoensis]